MVAAYPEGAAARRQWITAKRGPRRTVDPWKPHAFFVEEERSESGEVAEVLTVFLTNRECPWRCVMCDLWRNTLSETVPLGAIPAQIDSAVKSVNTWDRPLWIKLYNSGSFFDRHAIPPEDYGAIAARVRRFQQVVVECHPRLVSEAAVRFRDLLGTELEVAMGLETAHAETLARLNKGMTTEDFARAARFLRDNRVSVRAFVLLKPPFTSEEEGVMRAKRSIEFAFECGVGVVSVIPTRAGNGAMDALMAAGEFSPPTLNSLEDVLEYGISLRRGRVFADLWDLEQFADCPDCVGARRERMRRINLSQRPQPRTSCPRCGA